MSKAFPVVEITFSEITPANRNRLGRNFTGDVDSGWHASLKTFGVFRQTGPKWRQRAFCELSCHQNNASFHPLRGDRFPWNFNKKTQTGVVNLSMNEVVIVIIEFFWSFTSKTSILLIFLHTPGAHAPALAFGSRAKMTTWELYLVVERQRCFLVSDFFVRLTVFEI